MTIDEAINHSEEVAERYERMEDSHDEKLKKECLQCAADHRQLAEWLKELKEAKRLLRLAMQDMRILYEFGNGGSCYGRMFEWRYADEAEKILGKEI